MTADTEPIEKHSMFSKVTAKMQSTSDRMKANLERKRVKNAAVTLGIFLIEEGDDRHEWHIGDHQNDIIVSVQWGMKDGKKVNDKEVKSKVDEEEQTEEK